MVCCCESCSHYSHYDDRLYDYLSGILQYDMIASYLFVTYVICGSVMIGKLGWGGYYYYVHILISWIVFWVTSHRCMLVITLLLHMLYVIGFFYSLVLMMRYYRHYTIVTYDLCGIASVARYFG